MVVVSSCPVRALTNVTGALLPGTGRGGGALGGRVLKSAGATAADRLAP